MGAASPRPASPAELAADGMLAAMFAADVVIGDGVIVVLVAVLLLLLILYFARRL